jgi:hypothetical protein
MSDEQDTVPASEITRTDIALTGRELDDAVAREVMGWTPTWVRGWGCDHFEGGHFDSEVECGAACRLDQKPYMRWKSRPGYTIYAHERFTPSTDISVAWKVVLEMTRVGYPFDLDDAGASGWWRCRFGGIEGSSEPESRDAAPLAICRAALKAVRSK